jgi:peptidoglycan/xylan/chitin deacetylase (PgdA/CDA1 family)
MSGAALAASLSLDLDNLWAYQMTHGDPGWESFPTYLPQVVPVALDVLAAAGLHVTFFVVGQDAALGVNAGALAAITDAGHEVANHSFRHQPWLHRYSHDELVEEISSAEEAIEAACGQRPLGFRGPGYSLSDDVLRTLVERRYTYDCSTLPTVIGPLARRFYFRSAKLDAQQRAERAHLFGDFRDGLQPLKPYVWGNTRRLTRRDSGHGAARGSGTVPSQLRPVPRRTIGGRRGRIFPRRSPPVSGRWCGAEHPAPPPRRRRRGRCGCAAVLPRHGTARGREATSGRALPA